MTDSPEVARVTASPGAVAPRSATTALKVSMLEGALHAVMVGVTESYLGAFAVELGHGARGLALLATLPLLVGAGSQLTAPLLCGLLGGRKRLAVAGAALQGVSILGLCAIAWHRNTSLVALLAIQLLFWASGNVIGPAWSAWMADLTVETERARYFARRSSLIHVVLLFSFAGAGFFLHQTSAGTSPTRFAALFAIGLLARLGSAVAMSVQADPGDRSAQTESQALQRVRAAVGRGSFRVAIYVALLALGTQVAAPFFTPYMLRELELDYRSFALLSAVSILAKAMTFRGCHRVAERYGLRNLLWCAGVGVAVVPLVWAASPRFDVLLLANVIGGMAWAGVEYASFQLLLQAAPPEAKTEFFSLSNTLAGAGQVTGALGGAGLLERHTLSYAGVFVLSAVMRGAALSALFLAVPAGDFPRRLRALYLRVLNVRPGAGAVQRPIVDATEPESVRSAHPATAVLEATSDPAAAAGAEPTLTRASTPTPQRP